MVDLNIPDRTLRVGGGSPFVDNHAEGKVTAGDHSVGGAMLNTCRCVRDDAFVAA